jgi:hypothetical protein
MNKDICPSCIEKVEDDVRAVMEKRDNYLLQEYQNTFKDKLLKTRS